MKKANKDYNSEFWYKSQGMDLEAISQSQDLGKWYYDLHKHEIYKIDKVPILGKNDNFSRPPRSFDRLYKKEYPKEFEKVIKRRKEKMLTSMMQKEYQTDMDYLQMLESEEIKTNQFKDMRCTV